MFASRVSQIQEAKVVAIVRGIAPAQMPKLCEALFEGGIRWVEITLNSPDALQSIAEMKKQFGGSKLHIGAGSVLDGGMARQAIDAGAEFLLSPNLDERMIQTALENNVLPIPGVMTPSEIVKALQWGAPLVKLFPAGSLGAGYLKEIRAPLDQVNMLAVGGVHEGNIGDFLQAGAVGAGVGGSLIDKKAIGEGKFALITEKAQRLIKAACGPIKEM